VRKQGESETGGSNWRNEFEAAAKAASIDPKATRRLLEEVQHD
jgi:hypothetical protein